MRVQDEQVTFNVFRSMKFPSEEEEECFEVCALNAIVQETFELESFEDKLEVALVLDDIDDEGEIREWIDLLEARYGVDRPNNKFEELRPPGTFIAPSKLSVESPPTLELKQLPDQLKYSYLGESDTLLIFVTSSLSNLQEEQLRRVLREHKKAIGWTIVDIRGISPSFCMHKIY